MLLYDESSSNLIVEYDISFDDESTQIVLGILNDCFKRRIIERPREETFLLHKGFTLEHLKKNLKNSTGLWHDLIVYCYTFSSPTLQNSDLIDIYLGEKITVTSNSVQCPMSSIIAFILHHLGKEEYNSFIKSLNPKEATYINTLLDLPGSERLSCLLNSPENIQKFLKSSQSFDGQVGLDNLKWFEKIWYFKTAFSYATLTASQSYDRGYLNSIIPFDDMEYEEIQNIQDAALENTEIVKVLKLRPKHITY